MLTSTDAEAKLMQVIAGHFQKPLDGLGLDTRLREDLGGDSLDLITLLYELEQELDVPIPDAAAADFRTVGDVVRYLHQVRPR